MGEPLELGSEKRLAPPVKEFMSGATATIDGEGSILKASHIVLQEDVYVLPVMKGDKLIGVVRQASSALSAFKGSILVDFCSGNITILIL